MPKTNDAVSTFAAGSVAANETRSRWIAIGRDGVRDVVAGVVAAVVLIANIVSFGALMFPGDLSAGIPDCRLVDADWSLYLRRLDRTGNFAASDRDRYQFTDGHGPRVAERFGRSTSRCRRWQSASSSSDRDAAFHDRDLPVGCIALSSGRLPMECVFPVCAFQRGGRLSRSNGLFPGCRRRSNDYRPVVFCSRAGSALDLWRCCKARDCRSRRCCTAGSALLGQMGLGHARGASGDVAGVGCRAENLWGCPALKTAGTSTPLARSKRGRRLRRLTHRV